MAGRDQHFIPQFFQRGFGIPNGKKPVDIWVYRKGAPPTVQAIEETAVGFDFYSPPPVDNTETLDDKITDIENSLSLRVAKLRGMALPQKKANAEVAARLVVHLAPRTLHLRNTFEQGMEGVLSTAVEALTDSENFSRLLGLDSSVPSELFQEEVAKAYQEKEEFRQSGLPEKVVQRVAFQFAKENFPQLTANTGYLEIALERMLGESAVMARDSHNKGLEGLMNADARKVFLQGLNWSLIAAPAEGAIMPDCVVWGLLEDGTPAPYMLAGQKELTTVVMAISTSHLLVGVRNGQALPDLASINTHAAACSHEFYAAYDNTPALAKHAAYIADRSQQVITDALQGARETLLPAQTEQVTGETGAPEWEISSQPGGFNVQVSFRGEYEQAVAEEIAAGIGTVIRHLSAMMPLTRLEKVIVGEEIENNALLAVTERYWNNGEIKCAIVVSADVGRALMGEARPAMQQAIHVLAFQLAHVAYTDVVFKALPQTFTEPATRPFDTWMLRETHFGVGDYLAAHQCATLSNEDMLEKYREGLMQTLVLAEKEIVAAFLAYREHQEMAQLIAAVTPLLKGIFESACRLLGYCAATEQQAVADGTELARALERAQLRNWLPVLNDDLRAFHLRLGQWKLEELFALNIHLERLFWACRLFPYETPEGGLYAQFVPALNSEAA